jgi:hypothetical protein
MEYLTVLVSWLSDKTGIDQWVVAGVLFMTVGLLGKTSVRGVFAWISGEHKKIGEIATGLLALMDAVNNWQISAGGQLEGPGEVRINITQRAISVDGVEVADELNRKERRLLFAKARDIKLMLENAARDSQRMSAMQVLRAARASV